MNMSHSPDSKRSGALRRWLSLIFVLALVFGCFGSAGAQPAAPGEQTTGIADPYDLWSGEFLDFAPPTPNGVDLSQPDGAAIDANLTPAETGGLLETTDGYTILKDAEGWWAYATTDANGALVASALRVGRDAPAGLAKKLGQTPSIWLDAEGNDTRTPVFDAVREAQSPNASAFTTGDLAVKHYKYLMVLADFTDVKFQAGLTPEYFKNQISGLGASPTGTVTDLYYEMSYGQFEPEFDVIGPLTLPHEMAYYDYQLPGNSSHSVSGMITDLGPQLTALGINWEQYDNDKVVYSSGGTQYRSTDMVVVLHAGPGKEATGQDGQVWSHASTANFRTGFIGADGKEIRIRGSNTVPEVGFNIGVVSHEMGHTIGESDYYDTSYRSMGTGDWDLMAGGSWMGNTPAGSNPSVMNPLCRINQGWVIPEVVDATRLGVELKPRTVASNVIEIPLGGTATSGSTNVQEKLYVEMVSNRVAGTIFDKAEYATGLLIWHYDRGGSQTKPTSSAARYRIGLLEYDFRDGTQELPTNLNRGEPTDPWSDTPLGITPYTTPNTNRNTPLVAGGPKETGWYLMNVSPVGDTMTFDIVKQADVQAQVGVDRPRLVSQPAIVGAGPVQISAKVYNLTAAPLADVTVEFWATMGSDQVKLAETTLAAVPPGAPTVATATWDAPVAGKFNVEAVVTAGAASASAPGVVRVFARNAPVLLVDDDDGYNAEEAFEGSLVSLGVPYVIVEKTASLALMQQYELVIWSAGQAGRLEGQLNKTELADLRAFLNAGGKVWFSTPRLAGALDASSPGPVDTAFLNDYLGAEYPMSNQAGGGLITGTGEYIGGTGSYQLRGFPGRSIEDFLDPAVSPIASSTMLFTWDAGHYLGTEVIGDAAHNGFHVVFFGFNMSQVIAPQDRMLLTQQVLDRMGIANAYFEKTTYFVPTTGSVRLFVHDMVTPLTQVRVVSLAQPAGVLVNVRSTAYPGTYTGVLTVRVNGMTRGTLKVNPVDEIRVEYTDAAGGPIWGAATTLQRPADELPAIIYHDVIDNAFDGRSLPVMVVATDDIRVENVVLYYRYAGTGVWQKASMAESYRFAFTATIPASYVTPAGVEYYVTATDMRGHVTSVGSAAAPNFVVVQPRTVGLE